MRIGAVIAIFPLLVQQIIIYILDVIPIWTHSSIVAFNQLGFDGCHFRCVRGYLSASHIYLAFHGPLVSL
jgi:hypothetical protein